MRGSGTEVRPRAYGIVRRRPRSAELGLRKLATDLLLHPNDRGLIVVDLCGRHVLIGHRWWLIEIGNWGRLVGVPNWRGLIVDLRGLRNNTLHRIIAGVRE